MDDGEIAVTLKGEFLGFFESDLTAWAFITEDVRRQIKKELKSITDCNTIKPDLRKG